MGLTVSSVVTRIVSDAILLNASNASQAPFFSQMGVVLPVLYCMFHASFVIPLNA